MTNMEHFKNGVHEATALVDKFLEESQDPEGYTTFYSILGAINAMYALLGDGEIPIEEVQRQVIKETKLLSAEEI